MRTRNSLRILPALLLAVLSGRQQLSAQQSALIGNLPGPLSLEIQIPVSALKGNGVNYIAVDDIPVKFSRLHSSDPEFLRLITELPQGTPVSSSIKIPVDGFPVLHVTVADILGNSQNDYSDVIIKPVWIESGSFSYSNSISSPAYPPHGAGEGSIIQSGGIKTDPDVQIFPNPANEYLTIVTEGEILWGVVEVLDITGKKTAEISAGNHSRVGGSQRTTIPLADLRPGIYLFRFRTDKNVYTRKVQVVK